MSASRPNAADLEEGAGPMRWQDGIDELAAVFGDGAQRRPGREYTHPDTGRRFTVGERLIVDSFMALGAGVHVSADVLFGDTGVDEVTLRPRTPAGDEASKLQLRDALLAWFEEMELEPPELADYHELGEQSWDAGDVEVELVLEAHTFELTVTRIP
jgi:hypothetical protein